MLELESQGVDNGEIWQADSAEFLSYNIRRKEIVAVKDTYSKWKYPLRLQPASGKVLAREVGFCYFTWIN